MPPSARWPTALWVCVYRCLQVKRLRERELRLGADLGLAGRELGRLRGQLSRVQQHHTSTGDSDWEQE